jgi:hypothetical protein
LFVVPSRPEEPGQPARRTSIQFGAANDALSSTGRASTLFRWRDAKHPVKPRHSRAGNTTAGDDVQCVNADELKKGDEW